MKTLKTSLAILFAAALMIAVMAVPAFATTYYTSGEAAYYPGGSASSYETTNAVTVTLRVQSRRLNSSYSSAYIDEEFTVTIPASSTPRAVTVSQILYKAMSDNSGLYFKDYSGNNISSSSAYCYQVKYNGNTYAPVADGNQAPSYRNGWMFTINGKYPLDRGTPAVTTDDSESGDAWGTAINYAYVNNNDVVTFFYNDANSYSAAADHLRIQSASYDSVADKFSVNVESCRNWYATSNAIWHIKGYEPVQSATVKIYNSSNTQVAYGTTDSTGLAYLSATETITSGTYRVVTTWKQKYKAYLGTGYYMISQTHTEEKLTI